MLGCLAGLAMKLPIRLEVTISLELVEPDASIMPAGVRVPLVLVEIGLARMQVVLTGAAKGPAGFQGEPTGARVASAGAGAGAEAGAAGGNRLAGRMGLSESVGVLPGAKPMGMPAMPAPKCTLVSTIG